MATRSSIYVYDGTVWRGIYCHWDGYPDGVGATLLELAPDLESALKLVSKGFISLLSGCTSFDEIQYYSERSKWDEGSEDETDVDACQADTLAECMNEIGHQSYAYSFEDGKWWFTGVYGIARRFDLDEYLRVQEHLYADLDD